MIPNFFDPETSSCVTAKMTPYNGNTTGNTNTNKSYLNSNNRLSGAPNRSQMNANGSFIVESSNRNHRTPLKNQTETQINTLLNGGGVVNVPTFKISDSDAIPTTTTESSAKKFVERCCKNCQKKYISQQSSSNAQASGESAAVNTRKRKAAMLGETGKDLLSEFNLNIEDYSPNKKCANYIDANSFSPCLNSRGVSSSSGSPSGTPQSTVKKSLLAKAITNHVTNSIMTGGVPAASVSSSGGGDSNSSMNMSIGSDQFSCISNCSGNTSLLDVSPTKSSPSKSSRFTAEMDLNEEEDAVAEEDDNAELNESICEECKIKEAKIDYMQNGEDRSEVSLIMGM